MNGVRKDTLWRGGVGSAVCCASLVPAIAEGLFVAGRRWDTRGPRDWSSVVCSFFFLFFFFFVFCFVYV